MLAPSSPETELVYRLVQRIGEKRTSDERICELVEGELDWSAVLDLSSRHGVSPLLDDLLQNPEIDAPHSITQQLHEQCRTRALNNLDHVGQLHRVIQALRDENIPVMAYKGPVIGHLGYNELGQRWFNDLDLLVSPDRILNAREVLLEAGFTQENLVGVPPERLVEDPIFRWGGEFHFIKDSAIPVELRYQFVGKNADDQRIFYDLWDSRTSYTIANKTIPALSPEDHMVVLLAHGTKHGWNRLSWICDIALLSQQAIDWDTVLKKSEEYGWKNAVLLGLAVTAEFTNIKLPASIRQAISTTPRAYIGCFVIQRAYRYPVEYTNMDTQAPFSILYLNSSKKDSIKEAVDIATSPWEIDYQWISLPPSLYPLYYVVRPIRLGISSIKRIIGR
jgi:hypothetical protein